MCRTVPTTKSSPECGRRPSQFYKERVVITPPPPPPRQTTYSDKSLILIIGRTFREAIEIADARRLGDICEKRTLNTFWTENTKYICVSVHNRNYFRGIRPDGVIVDMRVPIGDFWDAVMPCIRYDASKISISIHDERQGYR
jgi:hypothetical protein